MNDALFLSYSVDKLQQLASRIHSCLDRLTDDQIWMRGHESANSTGNLVLHLSGNLRQWIGSGVAAMENIRDRDAEFAARGGVSVEVLKQRLDEAVSLAVSIIQGLSSERLGETIEVQAYQVTVLAAVYHVVEHFAQHAGQIIFATKLLTGEDLGFYGHLQAKAHHEPTP